MVKKLQDFFEAKDRFAKLLGFEIEEIKEGHAVVSTIIQEEHLNGADVVHGGFLFSLADYAFAIASNTHNNLSLAINANISFQRSRPKGSKLIATATELHNGNKVASYEVKICDSDQKLIASFTGTVYRKGMQVVD
jgi:acyl-CoA thioesterase